MMKKAFTLIEILIVVILLGILAAVVIPQFVDQTQVARDAAALSSQTTMNSAWQQYCAATQASTGTAPALPATTDAAVGLLVDNHYITETPDATKFTVTFVPGATSQASSFTVVAVE